MLRFHSLRPLSLCLVLGLVGPVSAQKAPIAVSVAAKQPIPHSAYAGWKSIQGTVLSRNGQWLAYALVAQEDDGELVVRHLPSGKEFRQPRGTAPVFASDGRTVAFALQPTQAEKDQARRDKKKAEDQPKAGAGWMDLATGKVQTVDRVKRFAFAEDGGRQLALLLEAPKDAKKPAEDAPEEKTDAAGDQRTPRARSEAGKGKNEPGTELLLVDVTTGQRVSIPDVAEFLWPKHGRWLAYAVSVKDASKGKPKGTEEKAAPDEKAIKEAPTAREGVFVRRMDTAQEQALARGKGTYKGLQADEAGARLVFLTNRDRIQDKAPAFSVYGWTAEQPEARPLVHPGITGLPAGWAPSEHGELTFSKDGLRLFLGTALAPKAEAEKAPDPVPVDLWHWKDGDLQSVQKHRAEQDRTRSYRAVFHLREERLVQLATEAMPTVTVNDNPSMALGRADAAYRPLQTWEDEYQDWFAVDLNTGKALLLAAKTSERALLSPEGRHVALFDTAARAWFAIRTSDAGRVNLTGTLGVPFHQVEDDHPAPKPAVAAAEWLEHDAGLILHDTHDLWQVRPDGTQAVNLTQGLGRREGWEFRTVRLDPEAKAHPDDQPLLLKAMNAHTKATGFFRAALGGGQPVQRLMTGDKLLGQHAPMGRSTGQILKAKEADVLVFTQQTFSEFPDLWLTDVTFRNPKRVSHANPQQAQYRWGTQERITYITGDGATRQAILAKPEGFDPSRKYPLMVYLYETYSDWLHAYQAPAPGTSINFSRFVSHGYVVVRPDIIFEAGHPGQSSLKHVLPLVAQLEKTGWVDPERIGIQGHSWGGYQALYLVTQTNRFKAVQAGAPVSNMLSAYGGIRLESGRIRAFQYERGQSRIGGSPWTHPLEYLENSPLIHLARVQTPVLMIHNDGDDAVPWAQGIEAFNGLRRLGKPVWLFNYNGDKHNLVQRENLKHWTVQQCGFFDHLLLGAPRPAWMDAPIPFLERGKEDLVPIFKPSSAKP